MYLSRLIFPLRFILCCGGLPGVTAFAQEPALNFIHVRTTIDLPKGKTLGAHPTFAMFPPVEAASPLKLVRPLPPATLAAITQLLAEKLQAQGYVAVAGKDKPEVLITTLYGRGFLPNPYRSGVPIVDGSSAPVVSLSGPPDLKRYEIGHESKLQGADEEKLFFTIGAWEFASMQKGAKPVRLWTMTVLVDDPDHRDLNSLYKQMLTAGADYFNQRIEKEEVEILPRLREGKVDVGTPQVVPETKPAAK